MKLIKTISISEHWYLQICIEGITDWFVNIGLNNGSMALDICLHIFKPIFEEPFEVLYGLKKVSY